MLCSVFIVIGRDNKLQKNTGRSYGLFLCPTMKVQMNNRATGWPKYPLSNSCTTLAAAALTTTTQTTLPKQVLRW